jgi:hypothetical protein
MFFCWIFLFRSYVTQICSVRHDIRCMDETYRLVKEKSDNIQLSITCEIFTNVNFFNYLTEKMLFINDLA